MTSPQFELEWQSPQEPRQPTSVSLIRSATCSHESVATGFGADESHALTDLWITLRERDESREAIA
jgi:hypothetical protein